MFRALPLGPKTFTIKKIDETRTNQEKKTKNKHDNKKDKTLEKQITKNEKASTSCEKLKYSNIQTFRGPSLGPKTFTKKKKNMSSFSIFVKLKKSARHI